MTISCDLSCSVLWSQREVLHGTRGEAHVPELSAGRFPALPQDNMRGKCFSPANDIALSKKCKKK